MVDNMAALWSITFLEIRIMSVDALRVHCVIICLLPPAPAYGGAWLNGSFTPFIPLPNCARC